MVAVKRAFGVVSPLAFAFTVFAVQAASAVDGSRSIQLSEPVVLAGVTVPPGSYTLSWGREPGSEEVQISIAHGRKVVATGKGRWIQTAQPSPYEALVYHPDRGVNALAQIQFKRSAEAIRVDLGATRADAGQANGVVTN
jgi:hypothetical protein